jgi:GT2 family glycosyltransferase
MLRVAICITTHNRRVELARTLERIAALSPAPDELRIVADGCSDGTEEFVTATAPAAILAVNQPGRGSIPSRNAMGLATRCDVFLSLDDDSYPIEADAIARIRALFEAQPQLAVAEFPQRTDERPASLDQADFGPAAFIGSYANSGAAVRTSVFRALGGYVEEFVHAYEEPDFALRCCAAGWHVRFEPALHIRHHFTGAGRDETRTHHRHARNELWSAARRCPLPWLLAVAPFRVARQFGYAWHRGWTRKEPQWWRQAAKGLPAQFAQRQPISWRKYRAWMKLVRRPHNDGDRFDRDFGPAPRPPMSARSGEAPQ